MFHETVQWLADFARSHGEWGFPIAFIFMFGECFLGISMFVPGGVCLVALGAAVSASGVGLLEVWGGAVLGAMVGDSIVYWLARRYHDHVMAIWPFSKYNSLVMRGKDFFRKWGIGAIFVSRAMGPIRGAIPIAAGLSDHNFWTFQSANLVSAMLQMAVLLLMGGLLVPLMTYFGNIFQ